MTKYASPLESTAYRSLINLCEQLEIDTLMVNQLLWAINAEADLTAFIRIISNLRSIIDEAQKCQILSSSDFVELIPWSTQLDKLLNNAHILILECGSQLDARAKITGKNSRPLHPLRGFGLVRNPLYSLLWNRAEVNSLKEKLKNDGMTEEQILTFTDDFTTNFRLLQWHLFYVHLSLMQQHFSLEEYLTHAGIVALLGPHNTTVYQSCQNARYYSQAKNWKKLARLKVNKTSPEFFKSLINALSEELDSFARPLKTLGTKWFQSTSFLRIDSFRRCRKNHGKRKGSTSFYVENEIYEDLPFFSEKNNLPFNHQIKTRVLTEWNPIAGWEDADLPPEEQIDHNVEKILISTSCKSQRSQRDQIMAAIGLAHKRAVTNQHLAIHYDFMTIAEVALAMRTFGDAFRDERSNKINRKIAALGILMYWTGSSIERIRNLIVASSNIDISDDVDLAYLLDKKEWRIRVPIYKKVKKSTELQKHLCRPSGEHLYLPDLWNAYELLTMITCEEKKVVFKPFADHKNNTYKKSLEHIFKGTFLTTGLYITTRRLSRDLQLRLLSAGDPIYAFLITGQEHSSTMTSRHYTTPSVKHIANVYQQVTIPLIEKIWKERYRDREKTRIPLITHKITINHGIGADHCPTVEEVKNLLQRAKDALHQAHDPYSYHNYYVLYVTLIIGYSSGYRAVRSISLRSNQRDPSSESAWISDKDNKDGYHTRRIWLAPTLLQQLTNYEDHRRILFATWETQFPTIPRMDENTAPYLFLVNHRKTNIIPVSSASMKEPLEALGYPLPLNSNRRFLRTELSERGCPIDVLDGFMGHWATGQEPHGPYSCLSPRHQRQQLKKYLIPLLDQIGLEAIESQWVRK